VRCSFDRKQRRMGRRPTAKAMPYGKCEVLSFENLESIETEDRSSTSTTSFSDPPETPSTSVSVSSLTQCPSEPTAVLCAPAGMVNEVLYTSEMFYHFHRHFMIGRSFSDGFQRAVWTVMGQTDGIVFEAYQAALGIWDTEKERIRPLGEVDVSAGRDCLKRLQDAATVQPGDAAAILMVGQILLVYHVATICTSAQPILRSALLAVKPFYEDLLSQPELDPITVTPILIDTVESLVRREMPVIKCPETERLVVDRSAGVCWSLLPLLQKLCECSAREKASEPLFSRGPCDGGPDIFTEVESQIRVWEPKIPNIFSDYSQLEVASMLLQARLYKAGALLIIHRLRYPLGENDEEAIIQANVILAELSAFVAWAPDELRGLPIGLPLLCAMLETREHGEHIVSQMATFSRHPRHEMEFRRFVDLVWAAREGGFRGLWFDLAKSFQMPLVP